MKRRPPRSKRTDTLFPYTTLFRSAAHCRLRGFQPPRGQDRDVQAPQVDPLRRTQGTARARPAGPIPVEATPRDPRLLRCRRLQRSEEHTSELQSLMRISYAVFCLKKKTTNDHILSKNTLTNV